MVLSSSGNSRMFKSDIEAGFLSVSENEFPGPAGSVILVRS